MGKRQADRLKDVVTELISTAIKAAGGTGYSGDVAKDYEREWTKILRITGLHPDNEKPPRANLFKDSSYLPLVNVTELSDVIIGSTVVVASAIDEELLPLKVTAIDNDKQIVTGIVSDTEYEMGFSYKSIRGHKA